jgi:hypothetical protein
MGYGSNEFNVQSPTAAPRAYVVAVQVDPLKSSNFDTRFFSASFFACILCRSYTTVYSLYRLKG